MTRTPVRPISLAVSLCLLLAACASPDTALGNGAHTIALVEAGDPPNYTWDPPEPHFPSPSRGGIVGVALAVPIELVQEQIHQVLWDVFAGELDTERVKRLRTLLNEQDLHLGREFADAIEAELTARRFSVIRIASPFERADDGQNPPIQADADVILTFAVTAAFDSGIHIGHHPIVSISGEVIRASDRTLLDRIYAVYHPDDTLFGWYGPPTDGRQFIFRSFEEMLARPADVAYALRAGEQPLASNITHLLLNEPLEEWPRHQGVVVLWVAKAK